MIELANRMGDSDFGKTNAAVQPVFMGKMTDRELDAVVPNLARNIDVSSMARNAAMSRAAFFIAFKTVTSVTPIQYQKNCALSKREG